jgi:hypothetical protein
MNKLLTLAAITAALMTSACITVIDASEDSGVNWTGQNAQPFDAALRQCRENTDSGQRSDAFRACMAEKGWTRD